MAADPMSFGDTRTSRAGAGIGIALAIGVTVGAVALLAPRLRDEMREDIFSAAPAAAAPAPRPVASSPTPVPPASLAPGESVVALPSAAPPASARSAWIPEAAPAPKDEPPRSLADAAPEGTATPAAKTPARKTGSRHARKDSLRQVPRPVSEPLRPAVREARAIPEQPLHAYREREPLPPRREWRASPRREDPWDYRTWREHRNTDMPSSSPTDRQPG